MGQCYETITSEPVCSPPQVVRREDEGIRSGHRVVRVRGRTPRLVGRGRNPLCRARGGVMSDETTGTRRIADINGFEREADELEEAEAEAAQAAEEDLDLEAPEADTAEQHVELLQHRDEPIVQRPSD